MRSTISPIRSPLTFKILLAIDKLDKTDVVCLSTLAPLVNLDKGIKSRSLLNATLYNMWRKGLLLRSNLVKQKPKKVLKNGKVIKVYLGAVDGCIYRYKLSANGINRMNYYKGLR